MYRAERQAGTTLVGVEDLEAEELGSGRVGAHFLDEGST
jgi:hypothetical protein